MPEPVGAISIRAEQVHNWSAELMCQGTAGLFLHGIAGIGKSVLAGEIADQIIAEHPGTRVTTVTGVLTVEQLVSIMVADGPSLAVLDQFDTNVADGAVASRGLAAVLVCLAEEITGRDNQGGHTRLIVVAREPLALGPRILVRPVGPLSRSCADELARSLPRLKRLTGAELDYAWRLTAGHPGHLRALDARLANGTFAELADSLAGVIAASTGMQADAVLPPELDPATAAAIASAAGSVLSPLRLAASDPPPNADRLPAKAATAEVSTAKASATVVDRSPLKPAMSDRPHLAPKAVPGPLKLATSDAPHQPPKAVPGPLTQAASDAPQHPPKADSGPLRPAVSDGPRRPPKAGSHRRIIVAVLAVAVVVATPFIVRPIIAGGTHAAALPAGAGGSSRTAQAQVPEAAAATWLASNVTPGTLIGCDPAMCASLSRQGLDQPNLSQLRPGTDVTADGLIVATPQARALMGSAIQAAAPELAASFGTGSGQVEILEVTPGGAAAYNSWRLAADVASRRQAGNLVLGNPDVKAAGTTWMTLAAGQVDERIMLALAQMAHSAPLTIQAFGAANPGAATEVPVRSVLIDVANPVAAAAALEVENPAMQPLSVRTGHGTLWVEYGAPSPLGLFQAES
jgi:hypothetical protein